MSNSATPWPVACQAPLSSTIPQSLLKFVSIELLTLCNHLILCCSLILFPSIFPSIRVFSSESALLIRWPKYWSLRIIPFSEYPELISFEIDLISLQSKGLSRVFPVTTIQKHAFSAFVMAQLSHPYMTTGKP